MTNHHINIIYRHLSVIISDLHDRYAVLSAKRRVGQLEGSARMSQERGLLGDFEDCRQMPTKNWSVLLENLIDAILFRWDPPKTKQKTEH